MLVLTRSFTNADKFSFEVLSASLWALQHKPKRIYSLLQLQHSYTSFCEPNAYLLHCRIWYVKESFKDVPYIQ